MALLGALSFLMVMTVSVEGRAEEPRPVLSSVIYDSGNPEASIGIMGDEIFEVGDLYEGFRVISFESKAMIVKDQRNFDELKWLIAEDASPEAALFKRAKSYFIVRQMKEIYEAQLKYFKEYEESYSPDLLTLIQKGFLANGFENDTKHGYRYRIAQTGETGRMAPHYVREPVFFAVAEPVEPQEGDFFFSVDQLGQVRFSPSGSGVSWGPVWDYKDHSVTKSKDVSVD